MEPMVLGVAGRFEVVAECAYGKYAPFKADCQGLAVLNRRGYYLCEACARRHEAEVASDAAEQEFYRRTGERRR